MVQLANTQIPHSSLINYSKNVLMWNVLGTYSKYSKHQTKIKAAIAGILPNWIRIQKGMRHSLFWNHKHESDFTDATHTAADAIRILNPQPSPCGAVNIIRCNIVLHQFVNKYLAGINFAWRAASGERAYTCTRSSEAGCPGNGEMGGLTSPGRTPRRLAAVPLWSLYQTKVAIE